MSRSSPLSPGQRAAAIKAGLSIAELATLREANLSADGRVCDCPSCGGAQTITIAKSGETFGCSSCDLRGDLIHFEIAATGASWSAAVRALEGLHRRGGRDGGTGDLFGSSNGGEHG